jgi:hypothetical protein
LTKEYFPEGRHLATPPFWRVSLVFACLMALSPVACRRSINPADDISIRLEITPQPVRVGESTVAVQLRDVAANPITHATIEVEADMAHPGMAPVFKAANETAPGSYQAEISFAMAGDWALLLHIQLADGSKVERQVDVRGVRSN